MRPPGRATRTAVAALVAIATLAACSGGDDGDPDTSPAVRPAGEGIDGVLAIRIPSNEHTEGEVDYDRTPPAGGDDNPVPAPCGFYVQPIPDEYVVHTLEHGAVWLAYATTLSAADVALLRALAEDDEDVIATPYPDLDVGVAVVASAWGRQLSLDSVSDPRLEEFVAKYRNFDTAPEAKVACQQLAEGQGG
jgi:hypothetical protein